MTVAVTTKNENKTYYVRAFREMPLRLMHHRTVIGNQGGQRGPLRFTRHASRTYMVETCNKKTIFIQTGKSPFKGPSDPEVKWITTLPDGRIINFMSEGT